MMSTQLHRATAYCAALKRYLKSKGVRLPERLRVKHDPACDRSNARSARAFAFVVDGSPVIHCSKAIEHLLGRAVAGVILHEIAHTVAGVPGSVDGEVLADEWIAFNVPEAGYHYRPIKYLVPGHRNGKLTLDSRVAKALECVSAKFVAQLTKGGI